MLRTKISAVQITFVVTHIDDHTCIHMCFINCILALYTIRIFNRIYIIAFMVIFSGFN